MSAPRGCVVLMPSIHDVVAAERRLIAAGIGCDMIPTPRQLSSDCGMALACDCEAIPAVRALLEGSPIVCSGFHRRTARGYESLG